MSETPTLEVMFGTHIGASKQEDPYSIQYNQKKKKKKKKKKKVKQTKSVDICAKKTVDL